MRKLLILGILFGAFCSFALGARSLSGSAVLTANSTASPTTNPNPPNANGFTSSTVTGAYRINGVTGYRWTICAGASNTLSGAGSLAIYYWPNGSGAVSAWSRNPGIDEAVSVTATSCNGAACRCQTFPDRVTSGMNDGWIYAAPNGVTLSAGTTATVTFEATSTN